ncbi:unnamed protein product [Zymoseptoria tritici ST99CH_1A5]|uniref:Cwf19-like C-terminal domain-containing protein n=2 Tax=Zymoseptoria tritici TaxID=1047171 RepID=A0A1Y6LMA3_ZYMTR|nr:unnamed protein product [Zymoseptoria tritici ST99CH_1A5]
MASKIVIIGDVNGRFSELFDKLSKLHSKQNFAFAIIAGELLADADIATDDDNEELSRLLKDTIEVPFPTYFALGKRLLPDRVQEKLKTNHGELCPNLSILGRKFSVKTSEGFRIAAVGGADAGNSGESFDIFEPRYTENDIKALKDFKDADILVTTDWPAEIADGSRSSTTYPAQPPLGVRSIAELCSTLKPRYHFSTSDAFFEREPFFHVGDAPRPVTRFLSLAPFGNTSKQKWIYAFSLEPAAAPPQELPAGCTASPFMATRKRKLESQEESYNGFRFANGSGQGGGNGDYYRPNGKRNRRQAPPQECYFCLSRADAQTHMIGSIGDDVYMTVAKGPLTMRSNFPDLGIPCHMLIIPLQHAPTLQAITEADDARKNTIAEMKRYREALHTMIATKSTQGDDGEAKLGAITWEISRNSGVHLHWQFLPIPADMVKRNLIEAAFDVEAENLKYPKFAKTEAEAKEALEGDYFKAMIWTETSEKEIVLPLDQSFRFDLQFGRRVLGKLLQLESRTHWKDCAQTEAEEAADADLFKEMFKQYDWNLED